MARYRVLTTSFIANKLVEKDTIIEYAGEVSDNLILDTSTRNLGVEDDGAVYQTGAADLA